MSKEHLRQLENNRSGEPIQMRLNFRPEESLEQNKRTLILRVTSSTPTTLAMVHDGISDGQTHHCFVSHYILGVSTINSYQLKGKSNPSKRLRGIAG